MARAKKQEVEEEVTDVQPEEEVQTDEEVEENDGVPGGAGAAELAAANEAGRDTTVAEPANDPVLGDVVQTKSELLHDAKQDALANHANEQSV